ncbi:MAG: hypothetical protein FWG68_07320 [Defluviitaleaceae bacterium]|nr:hypothetical protein [Defluviitaleaceae bacterium]
MLRDKRATVSVARCEIPNATRPTVLMLSTAVVKNLQGACSYERRKNSNYWGW